MHKNVGVHYTWQNTGKQGYMKFTDDRLRGQDWKKSKKERHILLYWWVYAHQCRRHLQFKKMVFGLQDNNGGVLWSLALMWWVCLEGSGKENLTFQRYVISDAQREQTISKVKIDLCQGSYRPST